MMNSATRLDQKYVQAERPVIGLARPYIWFQPRYMLAELEMRAVWGRIPYGRIPNSGMFV